MKDTKHRLLAGSVLLAMLAAAHAAPLIKDSEAKLPAATGTLTTRGITRGPGIKLLSPEPGAAVLKSPFNFKVAFEPRGGAQVDVDSVKVTYLKTPSVDLLDRVKVGLSAKGIELNEAEAPPGEHQIRISLQDSDGRQSSTVINFTVLK